MRPKPRSFKDGRAGFTLIELVIVVGLIAIVLAILTLGIRQARDAYSIRRAATVIMSELRRAQAAAVAEGVDYMVEFDVVSGSVASNGLWVYQMTATPKLIRSVTGREWPSNVQIQQGVTNFDPCPVPPATDATNQCAMFKPLGYAATSGHVRLRIKGTSVDKVDIAVESATGRVSVSGL